MLPTIGSKELVAWLPTLLGLRAGDVVGIPAVAYPTYDIGARIAGATRGRGAVADQSRSADRGHDAEAVVAQQPRQPQRPGARRRRTCARSSTWAREHGVVVASDECYAELDWREGQVGTGDAEHPAPRRLRRYHEGLLAVYSLSKQSNLAGYRAAFVAGDPALVGAILEVRKHAGMIMPTPVQHAMAVALRDDTHVAGAAGGIRPTARAAARGGHAERGCAIDHSEAGLYLWATREEDCWDNGFRAGRPRHPRRAGRRSTARPARQHVRIALTATDERIAAACARL